MEERGAQSLSGPSRIENISAILRGLGSGIRADVLGCMGCPALVYFSCVQYPYGIAGCLAAGSEPFLVAIDATAVLFDLAIRDLVYPEKVALGCHGDLHRDGTGESCVS